MEQFNIFYNTFGREMPLTKTGFLKSILASPLISGMMVEIAKLDPNDSRNASKWISDPNFNFYRNAAVTHGFLVDKYMPWRLVADISSVQMQARWEKTIFPNSDQISKDKAAGKTDAQIMKAHAKIENRFGLIPDPGSASNLFEQYYEKTHLTDAEELKEIFYNWYNQFIIDSPAVSSVKDEPCRSKKLVKSFKRRRELTREELEKFYDTNYWIDMCFKARIKEEDLTIQQTDYEKVLKNASFIMKKLDKDSAMSYINNIIKITKSQVIDPRLCQDYLNCS